VTHPADSRADQGRCWDISIEYVLNDRDPRRQKPLVDFCINTALSADFTGGSAFDRESRSYVERLTQQWRDGFSL
jgi:proteasome activator subunit 4